MTPTEDVVLDARGQLCPMPVMRTGKLMRTLMPGQVLKVPATDRGALVDMPAWADDTGNELIETGEQDGVLENWRSCPARRTTCTRLLPRTQALVVHAEPEPIARVAAALLADGGYPVAGHLSGGLAAWRAAGQPVRELPLLAVDELNAALDDFLVLDVREEFEYRHGHVPGARPFPSSEAWEHLSQVPDDGRPLAVICGDQTRSAAVASMLLRAGRDTRLVTGGMVDWIDLDLPVERAPARV